MRKLNIKLLSTASAIAFVVAGAAAQANDTYIDQSLNSDLWTNIANWNELNVEAATGASIEIANQIAATYLVQIGGSAPATIEAYDTITVDQSFWTDDTSSYLDYPYNSELFVANGNSLSANTTIKDALIEGIDQTAMTAFQTASFDVLAGNDTVGGQTTIQIEQFADGVNNGTYNYWYGGSAYHDYERDVAYAFMLISDNEIDASASQQGTAVIDGSVFDPVTEEMVNGVQQAVVSMNTIGVTAADGENVVVDLGGQGNIDLNNGAFFYAYGGQGFDVEGLSGGSGYWDVTDHYWSGGSADNEDPFIDYEQFTLQATNWAGAYAPHALTNSDPSVMNIDQKAFVNANTISVGTAYTGDGTSSEDYSTADFTIMATINDYDPENSGYELGQFANFNHNENNLATYYSYWNAYEDGETNWMSEVNVHNTAVATTILYDYAVDAGGADIAGVDVGYDSYNDTLTEPDYSGPGLNLGLAELDDRNYDSGVGDVALQNIDQVASVGFNSINNAGAGDLKLISAELYWGDNSITRAISFTQSVNDFELSGATVNAGSDFYNGGGSQSNNPPYSFDGPDSFINNAYASTETGDVTIDGVSQTAAFSFNSIRSVGDILGWTSVDSDRTSLYVAENDAGIVQTSDTSFYFGSEWGNEDAMNGIETDTYNGDSTGTDLSQIVSLTTNTMASNGSIISDVMQSAQGEWSFVETNDLDLGTSNGDVTGGNLSQTTLFAANSITTSDLLVATVDNPTEPSDYATVFEGGDLVGGYVLQYAGELQLDYWDEGYHYMNEMDLWGDSVDVGQVSQVFQTTLNKVDVAGDILIGNYEDNFETSRLSQIGTYYDMSADNEIWADESSDGTIVGADASADETLKSVQAAYLNVNSIAAGDLLSGNVEQSIYADNYDASNLVDAWSSAGAVEVQYLTQSASVNLNAITAGTYEGATIYQNVNEELYIDVQNVVDSISDVGTANVNNITQQAITKINTIGG